MGHPFFTKTYFLLHCGLRKIYKPKISFLSRKRTGSPPVLVGIIKKCLEFWCKRNQISSMLYGTCVAILVIIIIRSEFGAYVWLKWHCNYEAFCGKVIFLDYSAWSHTSYLTDWHMDWPYHDILQWRESQIRNQWIGAFKGLPAEEVFFFLSFPTSFSF